MVTTRVSEYNFEFSVSPYLEISSGLVTGQRIGKAFFSRDEMNLRNAAWMALEVLHLFSVTKDWTYCKKCPNLDRAFQLGTMGVMALNALNGYMGELSADKQEWFDKTSVQLWDYSTKTVAILSIVRTCLSAYQQPIKAVALLGSVLITVLEQKNMLLPKRIVDFWKALSGNTVLGKGLYFLGMLDTISACIHNYTPSQIGRRLGSARL